MKEKKSSRKRKEIVENRSHLNGIRSHRAIRHVIMTGTPRIIGISLWNRAGGVS
ncbi:hypothetical protein MITSMUL_04363 [Mitsuokella multacida DSM 20544]|uniref:Uncharacterized protein n=1 Tax=Mitsuokella multacida DSM 20544 TaxID=500635 RepID=C9KMC7_9FIRM|nr:hypothetical protein MITSMUL_04363 [Mitsuokella multacida DSM 20544]